MTLPDANTMSTMARYARHRAQLWGLMGTLVGPATDDLVARATDGRLGREVADASHFVGDTNPFTDVIPSRRDVFERRRSVDADAERAALREDLAGAHDPTLAGVFDAAGDRCAEEAAAWEDGDAEAAKAARMAQFESLRGELGRLTDWCVDLHRRATTEPARMVARLVAAHLSLESGVDVKSRLKA
ncbi:hypothetical protein [Tessaracoccus oleiagri]|uniref:Uncharacterized protein n=1 Tax=Tessaracoccus oleiagri TaxID=686624 RepID=A0A1G9H1J0_9ACTN|nr:hypothetical protein [Tessaracoccus oleiagri]SDL06771.1 hypothetical protein SAMN04488242_0019 [Tessaracoccus oleiagri]